MSRADEFRKLIFGIVNADTSEDEQENIQAALAEFKRMESLLTAAEERAKVAESKLKGCIHPSEFDALAKRVAELFRNQ